MEWGFAVQVFHVDRGVRDVDEKTDGLVEASGGRVVQRRRPVPIRRVHRTYPCLQNLP